jgi:NAD(P)-dependent dehydrogenase (short-subunit alcohol dehydrogenase family)
MDTEVMSTLLTCPVSLSYPFMNQRASFRKASVIKKRAQPEDNADMICFAASDEARFANGALLSVDAGQRMTL